MPTFTDDITELLYVCNPESVNLVNRLLNAIEELSTKFTGGYEKFVNEESDLRLYIYQVVNRSAMSKDDAYYFYRESLSHRTNQQLLSIGIKLTKDIDFDMNYYIYVIETLNDIVNNNYEDVDMVMDILQNDQFNNLEKLSRLVSNFHPVEYTELLEVIVDVNDRIIEFLNKHVELYKRNMELQVMNSDWSKILAEIAASGATNSLLLNNYYNGMFVDTTIENPFDMFNSNMDYLINTNNLDYFKEDYNIALDMIFSIIIYAKLNSNVIKDSLSKLNDAIDYTSVKLTEYGININKEIIFKNVSNYITKKIL